MNSVEKYFVFADGNSSSTAGDDVVVVSHTDCFNSATMSDVVCPCFLLTEKSAMAYDERVDQLSKNEDAISNRTVLLAGYFQSWRYVDPIASSIRHALRFTPNIQEAARNYLDEVIPPIVPLSSSDTDQLVRVGVHARRGDMASIESLIGKGYEPPGPEFYRRAMSYFVERYDRVQFIVCSDDRDWARQNIVLPTNDTRQPEGKFEQYTLAANNVHVLVIETRVKTLV
jgi:hypothetical protein